LAGMGRLFIAITDGSPSDQARLKAFREPSSRAGRCKRKKIFLERAQPRSCPITGTPE
jgi:hypothetical protein